MFFSSGLSNYNITLFHLFNHAFFKALLFLGAGSIISSLLDEQDMRRMGSLIFKLPFTYLAIIIGSLAILGFPFLAGFYSKDLLLETTLISYSLDSIFIYTMGVLTAFFTAMYSMKLLFFVFVMKTNIYKKNIIIQELNFFILIPLFILSILSIFVGFIFSDIFVGIGSDYLNNSIYIKYEHYNNIETEFINPILKNLPLILTFLGLFLSYILFYKLYINNVKLNFFIFKIKKFIYEIFFNAGFFNFFYNRIYVYSFNFFYKINVKYIEKGFFEILGPVGIYLFFRDLSYKSRFISPYFVNISLFLIYFNIILILYFIVLSNLLIIKNIYFLLFIYYLVCYKK
jgi:NADH-ubiquinone oxidoreductase chain 5